MQQQAQPAAGGQGLAAAAPPALPSVHTLARLRLGMEAGWPMCLLAGEEALAQYNAILVLFMQVGTAVRTVCKTPCDKFKRASA